MFTGPSYGLAASLRTSYAPVSAHLAQLLVREDVDAQDGRAHARSTKIRTLWMIGLAVGFAETLQLAKNEDEAHESLQRHLERIIPDTSATVLNRNNSADRLAAAALPAARRAAIVLGGAVGTPQRPGRQTSPPGVRGLR